MTRNEAMPPEELKKAQQEENLKALEDKRSK